MFHHKRSKSAFNLTAIVLTGGIVFAAISGIAPGFQVIEAKAAYCKNLKGVGSHRSRVGAVGLAQLIVNRHLARQGKGGSVSRRVNCVRGHVRNIPIYSCVITVRFCSLQGAKVRKQFPRILRR